MKILIAQPVQESDILQMEKEIVSNNDIDIFLYPEGYLRGDVEVNKARNLAREYGVAIVSSYKQEGKNRAIIINKNGEIILEREKALPSDEDPLKDPLYVAYEGKNIGYMLCMEILKGERDFARVMEKLDFIVHPIGVGMFSEEQFDLWISEAKKIARKYKVMVIGTSHADGSYRNCGVSIPIAYCIDEKGSEVFISKADTRSRILDAERRTVEIF